LATVGSLGDLHPFIALGLALQRRGVSVVLACAAEYRDKVESAGLVFHPMRPSFDDVQRQLKMDRAQLTAALLADPDFLFARIVAPNARVSYEDVQAVMPGADLLVTSGLAVGARLAAERDHVRFIAIVLQPMSFLSAYDPPVVLNFEWLTPVFRFLGAAPTRWVLDRLKRATGHSMRPVGELRHELGLPATPDHAIFDGQFSSCGAIALYSQILGGVKPDFPQPTCIAGFAHFDSVDGATAQLAPELQAFLEAGAPPLVFTLGSLIVNSPGSFYRESLAAARRLAKRCVLLVGPDAMPQHGLASGPDVHVAAYAPHSLIFPRAAAIVHQGGVGTLAEALRSGRPQLIVPHYADQADNAARAVRVGVARVLKPREYTMEAAARELARLLAVDKYRSCAAVVGREVAAENGAERAADVVLERLQSA
jgi:rhamnosyltransferase subunit B